MPRMLSLSRPVLLPLLAASLLLLSLPAQARHRRWDVGHRVTGMGLMIHNELQQGYGGVGTLIRFRPRPRFGLEIGVDMLHGEADDGSARELFHFSSAMHLYLFPGGFFELYGLAGMGSVISRWYDTESGGVYGESGGLSLQLGVGAQLNIWRFRLYADLRAIGIAPFDTGDSSGSGEGPDNPYIRDTGSGYRVLNDPGPFQGGEEGIAGTAFSMGVAFSW